ncbi:hypothetical protein SCALM49S_08732 [Streptomyces californicus]
MPARLVSPVVGFTPTRQFAAAGPRIDPMVSVPTATAHRFAEAPTAEPELEPCGDRVGSYGLRVWPPRALQPAGPRIHDVLFALPSSTAPAARSRATTVASRSGREPSMTVEPLVVCMRSAVSRLSLRRTGMPCSGPRTGPASSRAASASASGLTSMTAHSSSLKRSMRSRYQRVSSRAVRLPSPSAFRS